MDNKTKIDEQQRREFFWETALKDTERRKGVIGFLKFLIAATSVGCLFLSCLMALPIPRGTVDPHIVKGLVLESSVFIIHTLALGSFLSRIGINKKANSNAMVLIVILDAVVWVMLALSFIVLSLFRY